MRERGRYLRVLRNTHNISIFAAFISTSGQDFPKNYQHTLAPFTVAKTDEAMHFTIRCSKSSKSTQPPTWLYLSRLHRTSLGSGGVAPPRTHVRIGGSIALAD